MPASGVDVLYEVRALRRLASI